MSIYASLSGNSKGVDFKTSANVNEAWSKLLDFYNDCGLSPYLNNNTSDFSISWREFLFYFYGELENEGINVEYDPNILPHIETHKKNLEFANELPRNPNKIDDQDSKKIVESLRKVGIKNKMHNNV